MRIIWDNKANQDLNNIVKYIAKQSPQNALKVLDTLLELPNSLTTFPFAYPVEPFYNNENIRFISKWNYKLIYHIADDTIYIMRVFGTKQQPSKIKE